MEDHLGIGGAVDVRIQRRIHREREVALHLPEVAEEAVVHEHPVLVAERMAVRLLDRRPARRSHVAEEQWALDRLRELAQVLVVPRGLGAVEQRGTAADHRVARYQPNPEAVAVHGLRAERRIERLLHERVLRVEDHRRRLERFTGVRQPSAHVLISLHVCADRAERERRCSHMVAASPREGVESCRSSAPSSGGIGCRDDPPSMCSPRPSGPSHPPSGRGPRAQHPRERGAPTSFSGWGSLAWGSSACDGRERAERDMSRGA